MCLALKLHAKCYQFWQNCENPVPDVWISECSWNNLEVNKLRQTLVIIVPDEKFGSWRKSPNLMKGLGRQQNVITTLRKTSFIISRCVSMKCCTRSKLWQEWRKIGKLKKCHDDAKESFVNKYDLQEKIGNFLPIQFGKKSSIWRIFRGVGPSRSRMCD